MTVPGVYPRGNDGSDGDEDGHLMVEPAAVASGPERLQALRVFIAEHENGPLSRAMLADLDGCVLLTADEAEKVRLLLEQLQDTAVEWHLLKPLDEALALLRPGEPG